MNLTTFFMGIVPLIIFVLVDSFSGVKAGVIWALIFALAELVYTLIVYRTVDEITLISLGTVVVFGFLSYKTGSALFFKMQPVIFGVLFGVIMLVMQALGKPFLVIIMEKYQYIMPSELRSRIGDPVFIKFLAKCSLTLGVGFILHAGLVAYAALKMSNWWWLGLRGLGVYVMMLFSMLAARFLL